MVKLQPSARTARLISILEKIIANYKAPGRQMGPLNDKPKLSEEDLRELVKSRKDKPVAIPDVHAYFIDKGNFEPDMWMAAQGLFPKTRLISISGRFHYPAKGFMGWHTNSNAEGYRIYATKTSEPNKSFFRYWDKKLITEWEDVGWNFRLFEVAKSKPYWHCVYTDVDRYSFGFRFAGPNDK